MQQTAGFCKELSPTRTEHLMNRARMELTKLKKVIQSKKLIAEKIKSSPEQEQSNNKAKVDVSSLVKAKKNEMCVSEENDLERSKVKEKRKKHKSKRKNCSYENSELNNTLSLGVRVNIELANGANENNDDTLNPKNIKTILMNGNHESALKLKEKTKKIKFDENKNQKGVRKAKKESVCKTLSQKLDDKDFSEEIAENQENLGKNKIDLNLSATVIKTGRKRHFETMNETEETVCIRKHKKKKSRRESSPLEETICPEKIESSQEKKHKNDINYDSNIFYLEKRTTKIQKNSLLEIEIEHKNKKKKKKHKDSQNDNVDKQSEERKHKSCKKGKEESYMDSSDTVKKRKKKKAVESTESLEESHNGIYCNESVSIRKHKKYKRSRDAENVNESALLQSSQLHKKKKKKHKDSKQSGTNFTEASYGELEDNIENTNITENKRSNKRKCKHKTGVLNLEVQDGEVCSNKKKKEKITEISDGCIMDKQRKKKCREDSEEFTGVIELQKKSKTRKSKEEEENMLSDLELKESKRQKEDTHIKEAELSSLGSKSTKHKKKGGKGCKDKENADYSSETIEEINTNESAQLLGQSKKVKRKRRPLDESNEMQNVLMEGEHQTENMPNVDSVGIDKSSEQTGRHSEESIAAASDGENGQIKKKKSKSKEREKVEINSEVKLPEKHDENASQNVSPLTPHFSSKANTTFGRSPMERLLYGDPNPTVTDICTHCTQCSYGESSPSVPPVVDTVNVKKEMSRTLKLQNHVEKPCLLENIVSTIVIKKEPGLETENSNSEVIEPMVFIDVNNLNIKQEPGLETATSPDQANDPVQLTLHEQQKKIKKEPSTEKENKLNVAVSSVGVLETKAELQLAVKKEQAMEQTNHSTDGVSAVENMSNTPTEDTYLNSVISTDNGTSGFFRHASGSTNNIAASDMQGVCVGKAQGQTESSSTTVDIPNAESANNVPDSAGYVAIPQQGDLPKHDLTSKEASFNSQMSLDQIRQPTHLEEWIYEFHMVDVPNSVHFRSIADYFRVPLSKVREYPGHGKRPKYKHVVVVLNHYSTCLRLSKKRRLFGSRHTFIWTFKRYLSQYS